MTRFYKIAIVFLSIATFFAGINAFAAEIRLETNKAIVSVKEEFVVTVSVSVKEEANAVEGRISYPAQMLEVKEFRDGGSSVNLWIDKPEIAEDKEGTVTFSGITPGGWSGANIFLFSIVLEAKKEGLASMSIDEARMLENSNSGTEISLSFRNATIGIKAADNSSKTSETKSDTDPPELFNPVVTQDLSVFENKWFAVFSAQDKISGIAGYEIREYRFQHFSFLSRWRAAESPYLLKDQSQKSYVEIRASDRAGNARISLLLPANQTERYEYAAYWLIMASIIACVLWLVKKWKG